MAGRPALVGVSQTGPTLSWSGRSSPAAAQAASTCSGEWVESPISAAGPASSPGLGHGRVVLADVDAVGAAGRDQVGAVVEDEQRAVLGGRATKRVGQRDDLLRAPGRLLSQLDDVGAAAQGGVEQPEGSRPCGSPSQTK